MRADVTFTTRLEAWITYIGKVKRTRSTGIEHPGEARGMTSAAAFSKLPNQEKSDCSGERLNDTREKR